MTLNGTIKNDPRRRKISDEIIEITSQELGTSREKIRADSSFKEDLKADSLDKVALLMRLEEIYKLEEIPERDIEKLKTIRQIADYIFSKIYLQ